MTRSHCLPRRTFLKTAAAAATVPAWIPRSVLASPGTAIWKL